MPLQHVAFQCGSCGLAIAGDVGAAALGVEAPNENPAYYRVFWCPSEGRALSLDVEARAFNGRCASCSAQLTLLADFPLDACPRCHAAQDVPKSPWRGTSASREGGTGKTSGR